ncbi:ComF family protein [Bernardetia sp.]|uniref:ComF family protein n=1 Tax=Bernardetia sp. TaxID=1937974 RepID=UPI0025B97D64|nr:phosphoribosyltransferase family protein [Bernardetia sp.]
MPILKDYFSAFAYILFPDNCLACGGVIEQGEKHICTVCRVSFPRTNFHLDKENMLAQKFWGRVKVEHAFAYLFFRKQSNVQSMLHYLKYKNAPEIGQIIGSWYGQELLDNDFYKNFDVIVPVPLHPKKFKSRGYNQSAYFGRGISEVWKIPQLEQGLQKVAHTESQTKKSREERYQNIKTGFTVPNPKEIEGKNVLVVDDVVTTGATLEACISLLLENGAKTVSVAAIAVTQS